MAFPNRVVSLMFINIRSVVSILEQMALYIWCWEWENQEKHECISSMKCSDIASRSSVVAVDIECIAMLVEGDD
jgi:hypothetical protein